MVNSTFVKKITSLCIISSGATGFFCALNIIRGNEEFYSNILMPIIQFIPPETSHKLAVLACKYSLFPSIKQDPSSLKTNFVGHHVLTNPIGIAAGFDKQGDAVEGLHRIGFGFVEIGSVTPDPQSGNSKPRVFRLPLDKAIINRYGFNSEGHKIVFSRLQQLRKEKKFNGVLGINLGKNKNSDAISDYTKGIELFAEVADYFVINISSPNTPGLRNLQRKDDLRKLLTAVVKTRNNLPAIHKVPIFLKLAPDLTREDKIDIANVIKEKNCKIDGLIISNTTIERHNLKTVELSTETGGLSGAPLKFKSTQLIADMYSLTNGKFPIIGVGGIFCGQDAFEKIQAGASVVQIYTAFAFHGPPIVTKIKRELEQILKENNLFNVSDAVGKNYKSYLSQDS